MKWDYRISDKAVKNLKRFSKHDRGRIFEALEEMKLNPFQGDIRPIQGEENLWRRRVGSYRIYFRLSNERLILEIPEIVRKQSS